MNYETARNQWIIIILYVTAISDNYNAVSFPKVHKSENRIIMIYICIQYGDECVENRR